MIPNATPGILISLYHISAGVALVGVVHGIVMASTHSRARMYAIFAALCASVAAFQIIAALLHTAGTLEDAIRYERGVILCSLLWPPLLVALLTAYLQHPRTKQYVLATSLVFAGLALYSLISQFGGRFASVRELTLVSYPWGEQLVTLTGKVSTVGYFGRACVILVYCWGVIHAAKIYRQGQKLTGILVSAAFITLIIGISVATLKDLSLLSSVYTGGFGFIFLITGFTIFIRREIHDSHQALLRVKDNLMLELDSHLQTRKELEGLAYQDALTGLPNRAHLLAHLSDILAANSPNHARVAILLVNIDRLGIINDTLGHGIGDQLLLDVALRLRANVRCEDFVARFSGDEFIVVTTGLSFNFGASMLADKLLHALRLPFKIQHHVLNITARIGISLFPEDGDSVPTLLTAANLATSKARGEGGNQSQYYHRDMSVAFNERQRLALALRTALELNQFELYFQPIIDARYNRVVAMEALLRWRHPEDGMIPPNRFIPVAEETHLIVPIGSWVIEEAIRCLSGWRMAGIPEVRVAINLSAQQLQQPDLHLLISSTLSRHDLRGQDIELEITESVMMQDPDKNILQLSRSRELGVMVSMDDFGTGYSSLSYLKLLPVDTIKIDRSLVADIESDTNDAIICATAINMALGLGLKTVAEGVETPEQTDFLKRLGCDLLQGYYFARPMPASQVLDYLRQHLHNPAAQ